MESREAMGMGSYPSPMLTGGPTLGPLSASPSGIHFMDMTAPLPSNHSSAMVAYPMGPPDASSGGEGVLGGGGGGSMAAIVRMLGKRKRGRPRKYGADGQPLVPIDPLSPAPRSVPTARPPGSSSEKRGRGRPPGSGKYQQLAALGEWLSGSAGVGFTPHVITVAAGEDVATKIMSFSQQGPRSICILSANGAISNVTLRQPATSGGTVSYEGRFEILTLTGSFLLTESGGTRSRTGGLSVSISGPDGRVVGGCVAGLLMAASPVQVVVSSFMPNTQKSQSRLAADAAPSGLVSVSASGSTPSLFASTNKAIQSGNISASASPSTPSVFAPMNKDGSISKPMASQPPQSTVISFSDNNPRQPQGPTSTSSSLAIPLQAISWQAFPDARRRTTDINIALPGG